MRLLIATQHLNIVGGVETYLRAVLPRLAAAGFELGVYAEHGDPSGAVLSGAPGVPVWTAPALAEAVRWNPDAVFLHGLDDPRAEALLADRSPTAYFAHAYGGACVSGTKCHTRPGYAACERALGPGCLAAYLPRGCGGRNPLTMLKMYRAQTRRNRTLTRYRAVLVASRHMAAEYRKNGVPDERLTLAPLFPPDVVPDPDPPAPRAPSNRVLFVGRLIPLKGLRHLIEAVARASSELGRPLTLAVAGDGPERAAAESDARRFGVKAEFLGWVNAERRAAEARAADVLGVPSVWPEPFGLVGVEAGCVGLPAVGYATGGIPDWLAPGASGESAPGARPDPTELAAALVRALADRDHWHRLRVGAWEVAQRYTPDAHLKSLTNVLGTIARLRAAAGVV